jgi:hypothetical protein
MAQGLQIFRDLAHALFQPRKPLFDRNISYGTTARQRVRKLRHADAGPCLRFRQRSWLSGRRPARQRWRSGRHAGGTAFDAVQLPLGLLQRPGDSLHGPAQVLLLLAETGDFVIRRRRDETDSSKRVIRSKTGRRRRLIGCNGHWSGCLLSKRWAHHEDQPTHYHEADQRRGRKLSGGGSPHDHDQSPS